MALNGQAHVDGQYMKLLPTLTIGVAVSATGGTVFSKLAGMKYLVVEAIFLYGAGGTTVDAYVQTSLDQGVTWIDIMNFHFTTAAASKVSAVVASTALGAGVTPGDGALASNTILSGLLGDRVRVKYVTVGTYTGTTSLSVYGLAKG